MPATLFQQPFGHQPLDRGTQIHTADRTPGPFAVFAIKADHHGGAVKPILQARGDDPDHARMPAFTRRPDQGRVEPTCLGLVHRRGPHRRFDIAPFGVQLVKAFRQAPRFVQIIGGEQPRPEISLADAPPGIDPWPHHKAEVIGGRCRIQPGHIRQGDKAGAFAPCHDAQPLLHESAVHPGQRRHISHRRQCHQIKHGQQVRPLAARLAQLPPGLDQHQENHRCGTQMRQRAILVLPVGVHHGQRVRQCLTTQMVVQDDDIRPRCRRHRTMAQRAAIDADDEVMQRRQIRHGGVVRAITLVDPIRHIKRRRAAHLPKPIE